MSTVAQVDEIYPIDVDFVQHLHEALGRDWPCTCVSEAEALYAEVMAMFTAKGLPEDAAGAMVAVASREQPGVSAAIYNRTRWSKPGSRGA